MNLKTISQHTIISLLAVIGGIALYHHFVERTIHVVQTDSPSAAVVSLSDEYEKRLNRFLSTSAPNDFIVAAEKSKASVVYVIAYEKVNGTLFSDGYRKEKGSGVIISEDGYIVTNQHVIKNADYIEITLDDRREFIAEIIGTDAASDIALLKIESTNLPFLIFADSDSLSVGEWILAIGNPFGLQSTVTAGIISAKARSIDLLSQSNLESFIQSDAVINPGSSGGALVNTRGLLMGICTAIISASGTYEGLSFAIPSNLAKKVVVDLKQFGSVQRGKLGITISEINADIADENDLPAIKGVKVLAVNLNSAAALAGLQKGDILYRIGGTEISSKAEFYEQINRYRPGDRISLNYFRNGKMRTSDVTLRNYLNTTDYLSVRTDKILKNIGIEIRDLNSIEKERMNTMGVMVISVAKGSIVAKTNMEPGYIVQRFNEREVHSAHEFIQLLKNSTERVELEGFYERYPGRFPYLFKVESAVQDQ